METVIVHPSMTVHQVKLAVQMRDGFRPQDFELQLLSDANDATSSATLLFSSQTLRELGISKEFCPPLFIHFASSSSSALPSSSSSSAFSSAPAAARPFNYNSVPASELFPLVVNQHGADLRTDPLLRAAVADAATAAATGALGGGPDDDRDDRDDRQFSAVARARGGVHGAEGEEVEFEGGVGLAGRAGGARGATGRGARTGKLLTGAARMPGASPSSATDGSDPWAGLADDVAQAAALSKLRRAHGSTLDGYRVLLASGARLPEDVTRLSLIAQEPKLCEAVAEDLAEFTSLAVADLSANELPLAPLGALPALRQLQLACNRLAEAGLVAVPMDIAGAVGGLVSGASPAAATSAFPAASPAAVSHSSSASSSSASSSSSSSLPLSAPAALVSTALSSKAAVAGTTGVATVHVFAGEERHGGGDQDDDDDDRRPVPSSSSSSSSTPSSSSSSAETLVLSPLARALCGAEPGPRESLETQLAALQRLELYLRNPPYPIRDTVGFAALTTLDLSYNLLGPADVAQLALLPVLESLSLASNDLRFLPPDLSGFARLRKLSLRKNLLGHSTFPLLRSAANGPLHGGAGRKTLHESAAGAGGKGGGGSGARGSRHSHVQAHAHARQDSLSSHGLVAEILDHAPVPDAAPASAAAGDSASIPADSADRESGEADALALLTLQALGTLPRLEDLDLSENWFLSLPAFAALFPPVGASALPTVIRHTVSTSAPASAPAPVAAPVARSTRTPFAWLRYLSLAHNPFPQETSVLALAGFPRLEWVDLRGCPFSHRASSSSSSSAAATTAAASANTPQHSRQQGHELARQFPLLDAQVVHTTTRHGRPLAPGISLVLAQPRPVQANLPEAHLLRPQPQRMLQLHSRVTAVQTRAQAHTHPHASQPHGSQTHATPTPGAVVSAEGQDQDDHDQDLSLEHGAEDALVDSLGATTAATVTTDGSEDTLSLQTLSLGQRRDLALHVSRGLARALARPSAVSTHLARATVAERAAARLAQPPRRLVLAAAARAGAGADAEAGDRQLLRHGGRASLAQGRPGSRGEEGAARTWRRKEPVAQYSVETGEEAAMAALFGLPSGHAPARQLALFRRVNAAVEEITALAHPSGHSSFAPSPPASASSAVSSSSSSAAPAAHAQFLSAASPTAMAVSTGPHLHPLSLPSALARPSAVTTSSASSASRATTSTSTIKPRKPPLVSSSSSALSAPGPPDPSDHGVYLSRETERVRARRALERESRDVQLLLSTISSALADDIWGARPTAASQ